MLAAVAAEAKRRGFHNVNTVEGSGRTLALSDREL